MSYSLKIDSTDISSYVTDIDAVPFVTRNPDFTLVAEGYKFNYSSACTSSFDVGDEVYFYSGSRALHHGYIISSKYDYDKQINEVEVEHDFLRLKEYVVDVATFGTAFSTYSTVQNTNNYNNNLINGMGIIQSCLSIIGRTVDTSSYTSRNYTSLYGYYGIYTGGTGWSFYGESIFDIDEATEIFYFPNQLYAMGQGNIVTAAYIQTADSMIDKIPTAWDLLSHILSVMGICLVTKDETTYYVINNIAPPVVAAIFEYDKEDFSAKWKSVYFEARALNIQKINNWHGSNAIWWFPYGEPMQSYVSVNWGSTDKDYDNQLWFYNWYSRYNGGKDGTIFWPTNFSPIVHKNSKWYMIRVLPGSAFTNLACFKWKAVMTDGIKFIYTCDANNYWDYGNANKAILRASVSNVRKNELELEIIYYEGDPTS